MRWLVGAAAVIAAGQAGAQAAGPALQPGEVALHIAASGEATSRADRITLPVTINGRGTTQAEARASAVDAASRVEAALAAAGIDRAAITMPQPSAGRASLPAPISLPGLAGGPAGRAPSRSDTVTMTIALSDRAGLNRVTQVVAAQDQAQAGTPVPALRDDAPARRAAVAAAIARARHDADDYAAALGMRVVRVTAVSNVAGLADGVERVIETFRDLGGKDKAADTVVTRATSVVDFAIAPGR